MDSMFRFLWSVVDNILPERVVRERGCYMLINVCVDGMQLNALGVMDDEAVGKTNPREAKALTIKHNCHTHTHKLTWNCYTELSNPAHKHIHAWLSDNCYNYLRDRLTSHTYKTTRKRRGKNLTTTRRGNASLSLRCVRLQSSNRLPSI